MLFLILPLMQPRRNTGPQNWEWPTGMSSADTYPDVSASTDLPDWGQVALSTLLHQVHPVLPFELFCDIPSRPRWDLSTRNTGFPLLLL
jgi:hypothetical protein